MICARKSLLLYKNTHQKTCALILIHIVFPISGHTERDPTNYLTYFKRGTVYLALGKSRNALADLSTVLDKKPDFMAAR